MCGIVGYVGGREALPILLSSLHRLEYRGYDSAGVVLQNGKGLVWEKSPGKIRALEEKLKGRKLTGSMGLGHTRWATHGHPNETNAHPQFSCDRAISLVHNGIVENFAELKAGLRGHRFTSDTDTEVVAHLVEQIYKENGGHPLRAVSAAMKKIRGSFALAVVFADHPDLIVAARLNSPLVIGLGKGENFVASDIAALVPYTREVLVLEENEVAKIDRSGAHIYDRDMGPKLRVPMTVTWSPDAAPKGGYPHFMLKEIYEQQATLASEVSGRVDAVKGEVRLDDVRLPFKKFNRIVVAACGTAWHAGLVAKCAIEELAHVPVEVGMASELRYGDIPFDRRTLMLAISQSGETADTLAAARIARESGSAVLAVTNLRGCTLARESDATLYMRAGLEVGVAATKTYTSQLVNVILFAVHLARAQGTLTGRHAVPLLRDLRRLPAKVEEVLENTSEVKKCARKFLHDYDFMYIGRRTNLATAYEGALKMKEISYLHAEGYGAGEMKHGPLALVDNRMTVVAVAPQGRTYDKMVSNIQVIKARKGRLIAVATRGDSKLRGIVEHVFEIPPCEELISPIPAVIPLQLLAYHTAVGLNRDVDQPRNLAKSVTVE